MDRFIKDITALRSEMIAFGETYDLTADEDRAAQAERTIVRLKCSITECRVLAEVEASTNEVKLSSFMAKTITSAKKQPFPFYGLIHPAVQKIMDSCKSMDFVK
eukprot:2536593-Pyramimonas_sp.AAC.1